MSEYHKRGGKARAAKLTPERRSEIARLAAETRWTKADDKDIELKAEKFDDAVLLLSVWLEENQDGSKFTTAIQTVLDRQTLLEKTLGEFYETVRKLGKVL